jgi:hypothetical protein
MFKCQVQSTYLIYRLLIETFFYFYLRLELDDLDDEDDLEELEPNTDLELDGLDELEPNTDLELDELEPNTDLDGRDLLEPNTDLEGLDETFLNLEPVDTPPLLNAEPE